MKIILTLTCETQAERNEAMDYADALRRIVERRQDQGFPGMIMDQADSSVWVSGVELLDDVPCDSCNGTGTSRDESSHYQCWDCRGTGLVNGGNVPRSVS